MKHKDKNNPNQHKEQSEQNGNSTTPEIPDPVDEKGTGSANDIDGAQAIAKLQYQLNEEKNSRIRIIAEYDNYRRRTAQDLLRINRECTEQVVSSLLTVLDDFDRFLQQSGSADNAALLHGITLIQRKLTEQLTGLGLKPINSLNQPFDVQFHEAVAQQPIAGVPPDTVVAEAVRGYMLRDKVLRFAKVVVSREPEPNEVTGDEVKGG